MHVCYGRIEAQIGPRELLRLPPSNRCAHDRASDLGHDLLAVNAIGEVGIDRELCRQTDDIVVLEDASGLDGHILESSGPQLRLVVIDD